MIFLTCVTLHLLRLINYSLTTKFDLLINYEFLNKTIISVSYLFYKLTNLVII